MVLYSVSQRHIAGASSASWWDRTAEAKLLLVTVNKSAVNGVLARTNGSAVTACGWRQVTYRTKVERASKHSLECWSWDR